MMRYWLIIGDAALALSRLLPGKLRWIVRISLYYYICTLFEEVIAFILLGRVTLHSPYLLLLKSLKRFKSQW